MFIIRFTQQISKLLFIPFGYGIDLRLEWIGDQVIKKPAGVSAQSKFRLHIRGNDFNDVYKDNQ